MRDAYPFERFRALVEQAQDLAPKHQLGEWKQQDSYPATAFANCKTCGMGVVVDLEPLAPYLAIDGEAMRRECISQEQHHQDRMLHKRTVKFDRTGPTCAFCLRLPSVSGGFCSDSCRHEARLRLSPQYARSCCFERDRGICRRCGKDTERLARRLATLALRRSRAYYKLKQELLDLGYPPGRIASASLWDCDHIRPVHRKGGACGMDNLQTLCIPCHRRKTSADFRPTVRRSPGFLESPECLDGLNGDLE